MRLYTSSVVYDAASQRARLRRQPCRDCFDILILLRHRKALDFYISIRPDERLRERRRVREFSHVVCTCKRKVNKEFCHYFRRRNTYTYACTRAYICTYTFLERTQSPGLLALETNGQSGSEGRLAYLFQQIRNDG